MKLIYSVRKIGLMLSMLRLMIPITLLGQNAIKGKITDSNGTEIPDVSTSIKETKLRTNSNVSGNFTINARVGQSSVFSILWFKSQELILKSTSDLKIVLQNDTKNLNEGIVTALGIKK